jgi:hypothetical protein
LIIGEEESLVGLMNEYIARKLSAQDLIKEFLTLISKYNKLRNSYLLVYASAIAKQIPDVAIEQQDYYVIRDLLAERRGKNGLDIFIETPGGRGETAEEIVRFFHDHFDPVSFIVSGEAKSAGTIMVLSGHEILMTETGSLGPIDAQIKIGRSVISAYDYIEWINNKREEAEEKGVLNPFDATMVAQITPGELEYVFHALEFAKDLVKRWLVEYKFGKWEMTETRKMQVTQKMKEERAQEIANELTDHSKWRSHGRSIKINDLEEIGLKITRVDNNPDIADIVYRIQTVSRLLFDTTTTFKIVATADNKIFRHASPMTLPQPRIPQQVNPEVVEIRQNCPKCGTIHNIYAKFVPDPNIDKDFQKKGFTPFPKDSKINCECGFEIDLSGIKNEIEMTTGRKTLFD